MPAEQTTTTAAPHKTTAAPKTTGSARPGNSTVSGRTTTTARNNSRSITAILTTSTTSPTPTSTISSIPEAGGMSGAAIGGMAAGGAAIFAIVGLLFYKRRKRSAVGDSSAAGAKKGGGGKTDAEAMAELGGGYTGSKDISGPMALAPAKGIDSAPVHRPEAQFREQQQFRPGMRDELFAQPGSPLHGTMSKGPASPGANAPPTRLPVVHQNNDQGNQADKQTGNNSQDTRPPLQKQNSHPSSEGYYDDVNDYYGDDSISVALEPMAAQRSTPQPKNLTQGNLTPTPVSHLPSSASSPTLNNKGNVDSRGMGSPVKNNAKISGAPGQGPDSPRSSYSSDGGESAYLTLEQAQQAHNQKMMGHKESISSVDMLLERSAQGNNGQYQYPNQNQNQPYVGYQGQNNNNNHLAPPSSRGPPPPMSPDPYAESAYSDYPDDRSMSPGPVGGGYRAPPSPYGNYSQQQQQQGGNGGYYNGNGANKQQPMHQPVQLRDSDYNQGPYGRF
ncbi:hypothetical protein EC991_008232 [Linnemannia zychae]|nr:hypothetical protein EC991_008232 [Linnemannia zychae]